MIEKTVRVLKRNRFIRLTCDCKGIRVNRSRRLPALKIEGCPRLKKNGELATFGSQPKPLFTAENVNMFLKPAPSPGLVKNTLGDHRAIDPAKTRAGFLVIGAGHDAALIGRRHGNRCRLTPQHHQIRMGPQKRDIVVKTHRRL